MSVALLPVDAGGRAEDGEARGGAAADGSGEGMAGVRMSLHPEDGEKLVKQGVMAPGVFVAYGYTLLVFAIKVLEPGIFATGAIENCYGLNPANATAFPVAPPVDLAPFSLPEDCPQDGTGPLAEELPASFCVEAQRNAGSSSPGAYRIHRVQGLTVAFALAALVAVSALAFYWIPQARWTDNLALVHGFFVERRRKTVAALYAGLVLLLLVYSHIAPLVYNVSRGVTHERHCLDGYSVSGGTGGSDVFFLVSLVVVERSATALTLDTVQYLLVIFPIIRFCYKGLSDTYLTVSLLRLVKNGGGLLYRTGLSTEAQLRKERGVSRGALLCSRHDIHRLECRRALFAELAARADLPGSDVRTSDGEEAEEELSSMFNFLSGCCGHDWCYSDGLGELPPPREARSGSGLAARH